MDYTPLPRAALVRLDRWVTRVEDPPPSRYPRLADGTAVPPAQTAAIFTAIPGVGFPAHLPRVTRLDFGPDAEAGLATTLPPVMGKPYPHLVPAVDQDGNQRSGIRLPDLSVPVATYTGWNLRHAAMGAPDQLMSLMGATIPFPVTREARATGGDPRRSIEERYPTKAQYLAQVRRAAQALVVDGYLLAEERSYDTWYALVEARLEALGAGVLSLVSDRAKTLIKLAETGLECLSIPDVFHLIHALVKSYVLSICSRLRQARQALSQAQEHLRMRQASHPSGADVQQAQAAVEASEAEVTRWESVHCAYRHHLETVSLIVHPWRLVDSTHQTSEEVERQLQAETRANEASPQQAAGYHKEGHYL